MLHLLVMLPILIIGALAWRYDPDVPSQEAQP